MLATIGKLAMVFGLASCLIAAVATLACGQGRDIGQVVSPSPDVRLATSSPTSVSSPALAETPEPTTTPTDTPPPTPTATPEPTPPSQVEAQHAPTETLPKFFICYQVSDCPWYADASLSDAEYRSVIEPLPIPEREDSLIGFYLTAIEEAGQGGCDHSLPKCAAGQSLNQLRLYDYPTGEALDRISWLTDGVNRIESEFLLAITELMRVEVAKYGYAYNGRGRWLRPPEGNPLPPTIGVLDLEWVRDGIDVHEARAFSSLADLRVWVYGRDLDVDALWTKSIPGFLADGVTSWEAEAMGHFSFSYRWGGKIDNLLSEPLFGWIRGGKDPEPALTKLGLAGPFHFLKGVLKLW